MQTAVTPIESTETPVLLGSASVDNSNGNSVQNPNENVLLYFKNTDGSNSATVTISAQKTSISTHDYGVVTKSDVTISLATGAEKVVGPLPKNVYNDANNNLLISYTGLGAASVKIAAIHMAALAKM